MYGAGDAKIGSIIRGTERDGARLKTAFFSNTPALKKLKEKVDRFAAKGYVPGLDGRKVWVRSAHSALNTLLQSAGAIVAKQWMIRLDKRIKRDKIDSRQINFSHDELEFEVPAEIAEDFGRIAVEEAALVAEDLGFRCPIAAEAKIGKNWYEVH